MTKLLDSKGKLWALMSSKDKAGRIYIRAYRNQWDSVKKRSFVESKVQVGRLLDDGSIRLSKNFVDKFPQYAHQTVFWGDHELISEENFSEAFVQKPTSTDISWSCDTVRIGVSYAAWQFGQNTGIYEDLRSVFGEQTARILFALSVYKLDGGGAMMTFEDWLPQVWLPEVQPLDGRRISEMLSSITQPQLERYYKLRYDRACKHSDSAVTLSFDSTSISTYSNTINAAAWGHAKQNPELRQVNYMTVCDHATGDVVFACSYDGSINDQTILPEIYLRMKFAGLDLTNNILVTDRGFQSIYNTQTAINLNLKYIQFLSLKEGAVKAHLQRHKQALCDSIAHKDPVLGISAIAVPDEWKENTDAGPIPVKAYLHLYRDPVMAELQTNELYRDVLKALELKNEGAAKIREIERETLKSIEKAAQKGEAAVKRVKSSAAELVRKQEEQNSKLIDPVQWKKIKRFLYENRRAKDDEPVWSIKFDELKEAVEFKGCQAIRSNAESNPFVALKLYRQRQIIEQGFNQLKNEVGGSRFESTEAAYRGKLFVYTLAQALRMSMLSKAREVHAVHPELKMPEESMRKLITQLQCMQAYKHRTTNAFVLGTVAKRHRDLLALLGITKLPKTVFRFS